MLPYKQITTLNLGFFNIYIWGLIVAVAFLIGILVAAKLAKKYNIKRETIYDLSFFIILGSIIFGRLFHFIEFISAYTLIDFFKVWDGGMSVYGSIIGALLFTFIYTKRKKLNFWQIADIFAIPLALGLFIGRIGCYLIADHLGTITNLPWAIYYNGALRHPIALYHALSNLIGFFILVKLRNKRLFTGALFLIFILYLSITRFFMDFFRIDPSYHGLHLAQWFSIIFFIVSIYLLKRFKYNSKISNL